MNIIYVGSDHEGARLASEQGMQVNKVEYNKHVRLN